MPADLNFVLTHYVELQQQMRDCRESELKLIALCLVFCGLALAACALAASSLLAVGVLAIMAVGSAALCVTVTLYVVERIRRERATYEDLGRACQRIWTLFKMEDRESYGLREPLMSEAQVLRYGKDLGHLRTMMLLRIVGYTAAAMNLMIGVAAVVFA